MKLRQAKKLLNAYNNPDGDNFARLLTQGNTRMLRSFRIVVRHMMRVLRYNNK